jgi:hypothetical protein
MMPKTFLVVAIYAFRLAAMVFCAQLFDLKNLKVAKIFSNFNE